MTNRMTSQLLLAIAVTLGSWQTAAAIEIQIRSDCVVGDTMVTLGDVAVFVGERSKATSLSRVELFPAPPKGARQRVSRAAIERQLTLKGLYTESVRITGASSIVIRRSNIFRTPSLKVLPASNTTSPTTKSSFSFANRSSNGGSLGRFRRTMVRQAGSRVQQAIHSYLTERHPEPYWRVQVTLQQQVASRIPHRVGEIEVRGGRAPWTGEQQFTLVFEDAGRIAQVPVVAQVSLPPMVVIPKRRISRGDIIRETDVQLVRATLTTKSNVSLAGSLEAVVGREATRLLAENAPIAKSSVQLPILVKQRDNVVVIARTPGLVIRTFGIAQQNGRRNDLIRIQALSDNPREREYFVARVTGDRRVELLGGSAVYESERPRQARGPSRTAPRAATRNQPEPTYR